MDYMLMQYQLNRKSYYTLYALSVYIYLHVIEESADKYTYNFDFVYLF